VQFGRVLAHKADGAFVAGQPYLENVRVEAEILEELKGPKLIVRLAPVLGATSDPPECCGAAHGPHAHWTHVPSLRQSGDLPMCLR